MKIDHIGSTIRGVTHHRIAVNGAKLHYVEAGKTGSPILLVHGFPETWWTFHRVIPLLAETHRVFAVDLRGFGDSSAVRSEYSSTVAAEDLHLFVEHLGVGPMHIVAQDISGGAVFRLATSYAKDVASLTAIEMGLAGFGLEALADVTHGGSWHIGVLAAPGIPEMLLAEHEAEFLDWSFKAMSATPGAITAADVKEFVRSYARPDGWGGAIGLYQSMLKEGEELKAIAVKKGLSAPVLAIGAGGGKFTIGTMSQVAAKKPLSELFKGVGHYVALEAPAKLAKSIGEFVRGVDTSK